ncbi:MAG: MOSC domain-containing protein [Alphaproteobacteria bacterium]|nr:MOSC domain-containing protein [Alphaproteobacteria bacterium]
MPPTIAQIHRYPVKGLSPEALARTTLATGEGLPGDRRFALHVGNAPFDPAAPEWLPKTSFLMLMRDERLAKLQTRFDDSSGVLTIQRDGKTVAHGSLFESHGRLVIEQFFSAFMGSELRRTPRLVEAPGHMFSDVAAKMVSIIGLASVKDIERVQRSRVDPLRFRANIQLEGTPPWAEFDWVGRTLSVGGATLRVVKRIKRCAATNVDPVTAARDMNIPRSLQDAFGHADCGVYAEVVSGGAIGVGDPVSVG